MKSLKKFTKCFSILCKLGILPVMTHFLIYFIFWLSTLLHIWPSSLGEKHASILKPNIVMEKPSG